MLLEAANNVNQKWGQPLAFISDNCALNQTTGLKHWKPFPAFPNLCPYDGYCSTSGELYDVINSES